MLFHVCQLLIGLNENNINDDDDGDGEVDDSDNGDKELYLLHARPYITKNYTVTTYSTSTFSNNHTYFNFWISFNRRHRTTFSATRHVTWAPSMYAKMRLRWELRRKRIFGVFGAKERVLCRSSPMGELTVLPKSLSWI